MRKYEELVEDETNRLLLDQLVKHRAACAKIIEDMFLALGFENVSEVTMRQFEIIGKLDLQISNFKKSLDKFEG